MNTQETQTQELVAGDYAKLLEQHSILDASAGTGKTYSIVQMVKILLQQQIGLSSSSPFSKILLLTFTNKAALEMKMRIQEELYKIYTDEVDSKLQQQYLHWIQHINELPVYTIHSFLHQCIPLLDFGKQILLDEVENISNEDLPYLKKAREYFFELLKGRRDRSELNPFFADLTQDQINFLVELSDPDKIWDSVFHKSFQYGKGDHARKKLLKLIKRYERIECYPEQVIETEFSLELVNQKKLEEKLENITTKIHSIDFKALLGVLQTVKRSSESSRRVQKMLEELRDQDSRQKILAFNAHAKDILELCDTKKYNDLGIHILTEPLAGILELREQIFLYLTFCVVQDIHHSPLEYGFKGKIQLVNRLAGQANRKAGFSPSFQFSHVFIDEFQDTNVLEWETLKLLLLSQKQKPKICIIGDPKQAIYQFKGSDVNAYEKAKIDLKALGGKNFVLNENFRTQKDLLTHLNTLFAHKNYFGENAPNHSTFYKPLKVGSSEKQANPFPQEPNFVLWGVSQEVQESQDGKEGGKSKSKTEIKSKDLKYLSQVYIQQIQEDIKRYKKNNQGVKIGILAVKNATLQLFADCLEQRDIPYTYLGERKLFQSYMAQQILLLFYSFKSTAMQSDFFLALQTSFFSSSGLQNALQKGENIRDYQKLLDYKKLVEKKQWALLRMEILSCSALKHNTSEKEYQAFQQILDVVISYAYEIQGGLKEVIEYMEELASEEQEDSTENIYRPFYTNIQKNIELLTIHASKGLEFDVVYLLLDYKDKTEQPPYLFKDIQNGQYRPYFEFSSNEKIRDRIQKEQEKEGKNLFYVAITRAKHKVVMNFPVDKKNFLVESLKSIQGKPGVEYKELWQTLKEEENANAEKEISSCQKQESPQIENFEIQNYSRRTWQMVSYTSLSKNPLMKELIYSESQNKPVLSVEPEVSVLLPSGKDMGIFLHTLVENIKWIWERYEGHLSLYVQDNMKKYSFEDIPVSFLLQLSQYGSSFVSKTAEGKNILKNSMLKSFLMYYDSTHFKDWLKNKNGDTSDKGVFYLELTHLLQKILDLRLINQEKSIQELIFTQSTQEMTVSFQPQKGSFYKYIESTLDMVFVGTDRKIYFLDWKTDHLDFYHSEFLQYHVNQHYTLQWKLYLLAMVLFLQTFLEDFNYEEHIGGFYYVFVRGVENPQTRGVYYQKAPPEKELENIRKEIEGWINLYETFRG